MLFPEGTDFLPNDLTFLESSVDFLVGVERVVEGDSKICDFS